MRFTKVVFPEPFGPIIPRDSPWCRLKFAFSTATTPPNLLLKPTTWSKKVFSITLLDLYQPLKLVIFPLYIMKDSFWQSNHEDDQHKAIKNYPQCSKGT